MITRKFKLFRLFSITWLLTISFQLLFPVVASALTSGPKSPEFSSFEPVATTNMVNLFTGDLNYNLPVLDIPGPDGGGYALSLSYHSGVSPEQEASWVGYGFTLNPGAINRTVRGLPDDYNNVDIQHYNKRRPNWTFATTQKGGIEFFGNDASLSASRTVRINSYKGLSHTYGLGLDVKGLSINMQKNQNGATLSASVNPFKMFSSKKPENDRENSSETRKTKISDEEYKKISNAKMKESYINNITGSLVAHGSEYGIKSFQDVSMPNSFSKYSGFALNISLELRVNPSQVPIGLDAGFISSFNIQNNDTVQTKKAQGYIFNKPTNNLANTISDYHTEKSNDFSIRDLFMGVPFGTPDIFALSGEGLQGSFKYVPDEIGHFNPGKEQSSISSFNGGLEFAAGANIGIGLNFGIGSQMLDINEWEGLNGNNIPQYSSNQSGHFRFSGDMGGNISYSNNTGISKAKVKSTTNLPISPETPSLVFPNADFNSNENHSTTSYIKDNWMGNTLHDFVITNEDGNEYTYGLPVFNANEANLQFDVKNKSSNYLIYQPIQYNGSQPSTGSERESVIGDFKQQPYVGTNLLTQITTPDYIDSGNNGADNSDFGGWTKFHYVQKYNYSSNPYHWRTPYNGLSYQKNTISDTRDDLAGMSYGDKDVYYLKAIETKTHIAFFVTNKTDINRFNDLGINIPQTLIRYLTGSGNARLDGLGASKIQNNEDRASNDANSKDSTQQLEYLEKIVLVSKLRLEQPLKITNFEYSYELGKGLPNSMGQVDSSGKLTLKKVYFEYEGKYNTRISPYEFNYKYRDDNDFKAIAPLFSEQNLPLNDFMLNSKYSEQAQNPNYTPQLLDAWGNIQFDGLNRFNNLQKWLYQGKTTEGTFFDPAAWNLKWIKLPSGGEIHIGYEQKDYAYVQDREAMGLVSLLNVSDLGKNEFALNLDDIGITTKEEKMQIIEKIKNYFGNQSDKEKLFFKYLFNLKDGSPAIDDCHSEYITGYSILDNVFLDGSQNVVIRLKGDDDGDGGKKYTPTAACYDFYFANFNGKQGNSCILPEEEQINQLSSPEGSAGTKIKALVDLVKTLAERNLDVSQSVSDFQQIGICSTINPNLSYLKIPLLHAKKGGGIRVKYLMTYNKGLENGDESFYGSTFDYKTSDGKSSGVATNEPSDMREENALVTFLPRKGQGWFDKITAGEDLEQTEGPIGESLLPSAFVGYSRVKVSNIHSGKTNTGYTVNEYFTAKDYPFDKIYPGGTNNDIAKGKAFDYSDLAQNTVNKFFFLPLGIINISEERVWAAQGFRFILVDRHGQPKRNATYGLDTNEISYLVSSEEFTYYEPGEKITTLKPDGTYTNENLGKEMEVAMEIKNIATVTNDMIIKLDVSLGVCTPPPVFVTLPIALQLGNQSISTHVISKVTSYPTILKRVDNFKDGASSYKENIAFNPYNGKPLITKTKDEFDKVSVGNNKVQDGSVYKTEIPAYFNYPKMGPKSQLHPEYFNLLNTSSSIYITYGEQGNPLKPENRWNVSQNVLSASVQTFATSGSITNWFDSQIESEYNSLAVRSKLAKIWRPYENYVYKSNISSSNDANAKVYNTGIIPFITVFNWDNPSANNNWIRTNTVTKYSPNGNPLEEKNVLGYYNSAKYGYNNFLPIMRAENAQYTSVFFDDFENNQSPSAVSGISHSGLKSIHLSGNEMTIFKNIQQNDQLMEKGAWLKFWLKAPNGQTDANQLLNINLNGAAINNIEYVGRTGEWALYRVKIEGNQIAPNSNSLSVKSNQSDIYVDDIRFQPYDSKVICYVYDTKSFKLLTQFDDSHFGLYYQYNDEGKLVRKMIETEKGLKTITETQYNSPKVSKK